MDLWEYTKLAMPVLVGSFLICFTLVETANLIWRVVDLLRPRGRDED